MTQLEFNLQATELSRVSSAIGRAVLAFCTQSLGRTFHAADLQAFVSEQCQTAPGSADRILREMRKRGFVRYEVVRSKSLYRVLEVHD